MKLEEAGRLAAVNRKIIAVLDAALQLPRGHIISDDSAKRRLIANAQKLAARLATIEEEVGIAKGALASQFSRVALFQEKLAELLAGAPENLALAFWKCLIEDMVARLIFHVTKKVWLPQSRVLFLRDFFEETYLAQFRGLSAMLSVLQRQFAHSDPNHAEFAAQLQAALASSMRQPRMPGAGRLNFDLLNQNLQSSFAPGVGQKRKVPEDGFVDSPPASPLQPEAEPASSSSSAQAAFFAAKASKEGSGADKNPSFRKN